MRLLGRGVFSAIAIALALTMPVSAQDVSSTDVQRLQDLVNDAGSDVAALRKNDPTGARRLQSELDELQDEVIYLKVAVRKRVTLPRSEYADVRDRLEGLRSRARGDDAPASSAGPFSPTPAPAPTPAPVPKPTATPAPEPAPVVTPQSSRTTSRETTRSRDTVPVGTELDVRLQTALNSGTAKIEDRFEATTLVDLVQDGRVLIPAGSVVRGVVTDVKAAGRVERKGSLALSFDQVTVNGQPYPMRGTVTQTFEAGGYKQDAGKIGTGAAVGAIIGGILGGGRGVLAGILIGGGGVVAATEGQDVELTTGTILRMRFDSEVGLR